MKVCAPQPHKWISPLTHKTTQRTQKQQQGLYIGTWSLSGTTIILSNLFDASGRYPIPEFTDFSSFGSSSTNTTTTTTANDILAHHHKHHHSHTHVSDPQQQSSRYAFAMSLNLRSKPLGRWNRLDIQSYDTLNLETGDVTPVVLKHERPFWFSKVKSYA